MINMTSLIKALAGALMGGLSSFSSSSLLFCSLPRSFIVNDESFFSGPIAGSAGFICCLSGALTVMQLGTKRSSPLRSMMSTSRL